jgi:hypothetical protein
MKSPWKRNLAIFVFGERASRLGEKLKPDTIRLHHIATVWCGSARFFTASKFWGLYF